MKAFLAFAALVIGLLVVAATWPVSLWLIVAALAWIMTLDAKGPWGRALSSLALSASISLGIVFALLLAYQWLPGGQNPETVTGIERFFIGLDKFLVAWLKPTTWQFVWILVGLLLANRFLPHWHLVSRSLAAKQRVGKVVAVVAMASNFTFFTNASLIEPVDGKVRARYRTAEERRNKSVGRAMAIEAVRRAMVKADPSQLNSIRILARETSRIPDADIHWRKTTANYMTHDDLRGLESIAGRAEPAATAGVLDRAATVSSRLDETVSLERAAVKMERQLGEAEKSLRAIASELLSMPEGALLDGAWLHVESFVDEFVPGMGEVIHKYGGKMTDSIKDRAIRAASDRLDAALTARGTRTAHATEAAVHHEFQIVMSRAAMEESETAAKLATDYASKASSLIKGGDLETGGKLAKSASAAADDAVRAAGFVERQGHLVTGLAGGRDAILSASVMEAASGAARAARAAQAARVAELAASAAHAAQVARAAAKAAEVARAAKAAAPAAEGAGLVKLLKFIPK